MLRGSDIESEMVSGTSGLRGPGIDKSQKDIRPFQDRLTGTQNMHVLGRTTPKQFRGSSSSHRMVVVSNLVSKLQKSLHCGWPQSLT